MILAFLLKSTACLAIFLAFYKLVLEKESIHTFKRFFLLGALITSFVIPNIVFTEYVEVTPGTEISIPQVTEGLQAMNTETVAPKASFLDWNVIVWSIYGIGVIIFGFRFIRHLLQIWSRIRLNPKLKENLITRVLLRQSVAPHTFFNYIFLNKKEFEEKNIPIEVLLHEETHAKQRHSLDVILVEMVQVLFWFNPLIYFLKSSIKLNHEFLADNAVVNSNISIPKYQHLLLSFLSKASENHHSSIKIANAIVYSSTRAERSRSIKKRFTVMKTKTSKKSIVLRSFLLLPLTTILLFGFSEKKEIPISEKAALETTLKSKNNVDYSPWSATKDELLKFNALAKKYNAIPVEKRKIPMDDLKTLETIYGKMNEAQKKVAQPFPECLPQNQKRVDFIEININNNGQLLVQDDLIRLEDLKTYLSKLNEHLSFDDRKKVVRSIIKVDTKTPKEVIQKVDKILTEYGSATINIIGPEESIQIRQQQSATREEMKEYNTLAKKYNEMDRNQMYIKKSEVSRLKVIYGKMSKKQRADAEPFPDFPPLPPTPDAPKPPKNASDTDYAANQIEAIIEKQDPYDVVGGNIGVTQPKQPEPVLPPTYINETNPNLPPTPPKPKSPLVLIKEMAEKGATFTHNGKKISAEKAIEVIKKNNKINIDVRGNSGKEPIVKLSTAPIQIED
ncbi:M56 family metallopeptidase [Maribacter cobaltidurans]|uniref:Uncharacterized protein n=1 Tax=Maribacter cobaltidurans TaxID=1178778 RepID=A0A223V2H6_9FLAO|nr:M56 family metallopeptidase [Maribacter cobaltidurans]ASV29633.1 hypothetical protein CJ263_05060 [Maribacter cobaltidurans]GGD67216.1 hypothetical protein GCM10011412_01030 [Maribacter cobaltidurans]